MNIGVLAETRAGENRVSLTPTALAALVRAGNTLYVESGAGATARFGDDEYRAAGATLVFDREEIFGRSDLLLKVSALEPLEASLVHEGQAVMAFHHLAAASRPLVETLLDRGATLIGYEVIEDSQRDLPILHAMSEIAGQLAVHVAAHHLETRSGGRGILLGGATGIPPANVVVLGAGVVGRWAARTAVGNRAQVTMIDTSLPALRRAEESFGRSIVTEVAHPKTLARAAAYADVLIGGVLIRGERAPILVTRDMVRSMKAGSVVIDVSIDQGGCVETSRPTTLADPIFVEEGVTHFAVPNMTSVVARTASIALSHASLPFILALAEQGVAAALAGDAGIRAGVYVYQGEVVSAGIGHVFGVAPGSLADRIGSPPSSGQTQKSFEGART